MFDWFNKKKIKKQEENSDNFMKILNETLDRTKNKNKELEHNNLILLENSIELRKKITYLENNIEFLTNNLSTQKKKRIGLK